MSVRLLNICWKIRLSHVSFKLMQLGSPNSDVDCIYKTGLLSYFISYVYFFAFGILQVGTSNPPQTKRNLPVRIPNWFGIWTFTEWRKLMQSNQPQAKINFKSDSNRLLINFFDPISAIRSTRCDDLIRIRTIHIEKLIKIDWNRWILNRTEIDDRFWPAWNPNRRHFASRGLIELE